MKLVAATPDDCALLAQMNKQLINDEGSDNPMNVAELTVRMQGFLRGSYCAWFVVDDMEQVIGYALVDMASTPYYVRHFFIAVPFRRRGMGRMAFALLRGQLDYQPLELDVLMSNPTGLAFWQALGLHPRSMRLRTTVSHNTLK